jgi:RNA polymerase sigma-70 factor (ECF subfamily)
LGPQPWLGFRYAGADWGSDSGAFASFPEIEEGRYSTDGIGVFVFLMPARASLTSGRRLSGHTASKSPLVIGPEKGYTSPPEVLNCVPLSGSRGKLLQFHSFDDDYLGRLREGDFPTQEHFRKYFTVLMKAKLRSRLKSLEAIEDVQQETFVRFYGALRDGRIQHANRLGQWINSTCNNVLLETYRSNDRTDSLDDGDARELPAAAFDLSKIIDDRQAAQKVQKVLEQLPERDRRVLRAIFFEERDKDEVCRELGITRDNLRLLLYRAKQKFKDLYDDGDDSLRLVPA